ncbi:TPA: tRNA (adenosine(37)-N6)-dimethylallyltransferase MiaA [Candidatus Dojkabacteria bacterium]|uniref:tRNA dimethylallyltransferase n=1 Tax=Candidatus Dojkabacteria bacterium TaxID=2099670 RepID=A0A832QD76_9BACT|nr:tRNA (adenosine(37)-N6)-dimethylallyltransferase MiaA [Candidatus Dojkabacteria bacterium]
MGNVSKQTEYRKKPIIVIAGCTASGKSSVALELAKHINGVIINADSRQVYKEISIGTAKPVPEEIRNGIWYIDNIPHLLYSYISVKEEYNLYRYQKDVFKILKELPEDITPILVGGTGLYIDSVVFNYKLQEQEKNLGKERSELEDLDITELQNIVGKEKLTKLNSSDQNNPHRLIQIILKGSLPSIEKGPELEHRYFFLDIPKDKLEKNIVRRVDAMFKSGLIEENQKIKEEGLDIYPALNSIGYREFREKEDLDEIREDIITHTKQYAKRQRTWFRRNKNIIYVKNQKIFLKTLIPKN